LDLELQHIETVIQGYFGSDWLAKRTDNLLELFHFEGSPFGFYYANTGSIAEIFSDFLLDFC